VFIGPCIAKKGEAAMTDNGDRIDAALTFRELRTLLATAGLDAAQVAPSDFDLPRAGLGNVFPMPGGALQTAGIQEDLTSHDVVTAHGRSAFPEALVEFSSGGLKARLLELLCCGSGCAMGAGMSSTAPPFTRRSRISQYAHRRAEAFDREAWLAEMKIAAEVPLDRTFRADNQSLPVPNTSELAALMIAMGKLRAEDELNCGACGYDTCREHAIAIYRGLAEHAMCLPFTIERLRQTVADLDRSHNQLATAQQALVQAEKLASMGQLSAGIAHEVNNPLGVVLLYAHILLDSCQPGTPLYKDLVMIVEQADRCKTIVAGLLDFARQNKVVLMPTAVVDLFARALRSVPLPPNIAVAIEHADPALAADLDVDQMNQVLTNLITNAVAAMPQGGRLTLRSGQSGDQVWFSVEDTGQGIPRENLNRVFEPFFTTRQMGRGTGLGLAVSYGIVKMHRGGIRLKSNADPAAGPTGSTFTVTVPRLERREENLPLFAADMDGNERTPTS
jgi:signal transduction histidine kinase